MGVHGQLVHSEGKERLGKLGVGGELSAHADPRALPVSVCHGEPYHSQQRNMARVEILLEVGILPVRREGILGEVVCADAEEVQLPCEKVAYHDSTGGFYHRADFHVPAVRDALLLQLTLYLADYRLGHAHVLDGAYHREHNRKLTVRGGS